jgi:hypothetical protein
MNRPTTATTAIGSRIAGRKPSPETRLRLFCFPYTGSSALRSDYYLLPVANASWPALFVEHKSTSFLRCCPKNYTETAETGDR